MEQAANQVDAPTNTTGPTAEEFRAIYNERMRQATAAAALRRMGQQQGAAAAADSPIVQSENRTDAPSPSPVTSTPTSQVSTPQSAVDPTQLTLQEMRRREVKERIIASRNLLLQQQQQLQQQQAVGASVNPIGATPVRNMEVAPQPPQPEAAPVHEANPGNGNGFFADEAAQAPAQRQPLNFHQWFDNIGENFVFDFLLQPFFLTLLLPFPAVVTIALVIGAKVLMKISGNMRLRVADNRPAQPEAVDQPAPADPQHQADAPPVPPAPKVKRSRTYKFFYILFRAIATFFVSMFPFFTIEGLKREMARDGVIEMDAEGQGPQ